jgi:hypothetical protein
MAKTYYAWSAINKVEAKEGGYKTSDHIKEGDTVTASKLDMSDDDFEYLIETGAVREQPYPPCGPGQSPTEYMRSLATRAHSGELSNDEVGELMELLSSGQANALTAGQPPILAPEGVEEGTGPSKDATPSK